MDNRNEEIKLIFSEAYKKKTLQERKDYLDKECSKDADLRAEVESLLEAYNDVEGFLDSPVFNKLANPGRKKAKNRQKEKQGRIGPCEENKWIVFKNNQGAPERNLDQFSQHQAQHNGSSGEAVLAHFISDHAAD